MSYCCILVLIFVSWFDVFAFFSRRPVDVWCILIKSSFSWQYCLYVAVEVWGARCALVRVVPEDVRKLRPHMKAVVSILQRVGRCLHPIAGDVTRIFYAYAVIVVGNNSFDMSTSSVNLPFYALSYCPTDSCIISCLFDI